MKVILAIPVSGIAFWDRLSCELRDLGYNVTVLSEVSSTAYRKQSVIFRWIQRFRIYICFPIRVLYRITLLGREKPIQVLCPNTPFYLPFLVIWMVACRPFQLVHLLYDLYPEVFVLSGILRKGSIVCEGLKIVTTTTLAKSNLNVFLGERLLSYARSRYAERFESVVIEVGGDGKQFSDLVEVPCPPVKILYSGNFGHAHDTDTIGNVLKAGIDPRVEIEICGFGVGITRLQEMLGNRLQKSLVRFSSPESDEAWVKKMERAHVALVTMKNGAENVLFPSKTYSAMLAGQAVLAVCPKNSDLGKTVNIAECGWVVEPGGFDALRLIINSLPHQLQILNEKRVRAQTYARARYDMKPIAEKWKACLGFYATKEYIDNEMCI